MAFAQLGFATSAFSKLPLGALLFAILVGTLCQVTSADHNPDATFQPGSYNGNAEIVRLQKRGKAPPYPSERRPRRSLSESDAYRNERHGRISQTQEGEDQTEQNDSHEPIQERGDGDITHVFASNSDLAGMGDSTIPNGRDQTSATQSERNLLARVRSSGPARVRNRSASREIREGTSYIRPEDRQRIPSVESLLQQQPQHQHQSHQPDQRRLHVSHSTNDMLAGPDRNVQAQRQRLERLLEELEHTTRHRREEQPPEDPK